MNSSSDGLYATVTKPFNNWPDKKLATECKQIQLAMTGNPGFLNPDPDMATFTAAVDAFIVQLGKAATRDNTAVAAKNAKRFELVGLCVTLSNSVASIANGNRELLVSTLVPLRKRPQPLVLASPANFRITNGINPSELILKINGSKARSVIFDYTLDPPTDESIWTRIICSTSRCTVKGLQPGKRYWFKASLVGGNGQLVHGETILSPYVQ